MNAAETLADRLLTEFAFLEATSEANRTCKRKAVGCSCIEPYSDGGTGRLFLAINGPTERHGKDWCNGIKGACGCPHAEPKLMLKLEHATNSFSLRKSIIVCTYSPCTNCANVILSSEHVKISRLAFKHLTEHDQRGLEILKAAGFETATWDELYNVANRVYPESTLKATYDILNKWVA